MRRRIAAIGEAVDKNLRLRQAVIFRLLQNPVKVLEHSVHAAVGHDAHDVQLRGRRRLHARDCGAPHGITRELFFRK